MTPAAVAPRAPVWEWGVSPRYVAVGLRIVRYDGAPLRTEALPIPESWAPPPIPKPQGAVTAVGAETLAPPTPAAQRKVRSRAANARL